MNIFLFSRCYPNDEYCIIRTRVLPFFLFHPLQNKGLCKGSCSCCINFLPALLADTCEISFLFVFRG